MIIPPDPDPAGHPSPSLPSSPLLGTRSFQAAAAAVHDARGALTVHCPGVRAANGPR